MGEPAIVDYTDRAALAVHAVLIELGQVLGAYRGKFVVIGGAVPWLLLKNASPRHIGTLDVDLDLDPAALADGEYVNFVNALESAGYERGVEGLRKFQLRRVVHLSPGDAIAVIVDLLMPREANVERHHPPLKDGLAVQKADGAAIALSFNVPIRLTGKMPDGRNNSVEVLVATIPALLVMKGYALVGRAKSKDAYDIYFSIRSYPGGPERLALDCADLMEDAIARTGLTHISSKFGSNDDFGPQTVRRFLEESNFDEMSPQQVQEDAFRQVRSFLDKLGIA